MLENATSMGNVALVVFVCIAGVLLFIKFIKPGVIVRGATSIKKNSSDRAPAESDGADDGDDLQNCAVIKKQSEHKRKEHDELL